MNTGLMNILDCPYCHGGDLRLYPSDGERATEAERGIIVCGGCGRWFHLEQGIPSFIFGADLERLEPFLRQWGDELRRRLDTSLARDAALDAAVSDGEYWARFYRQALERGYRHFLDIRQPVAPLYGQGLAETLHFSGPDGHYRHEHEPYLRHLFDILVSRKTALTPGSLVLETGCGAGWLSLELARRGLRPVGLDTGFHALVLARQYARSQGVAVEYVHADGGRPPFRPDVFDGLIAFQALHHIPDLFEARDRLAEVLTRDGLVVFFEHRADRTERLNIFVRRINDTLFLKVAGRYRFRTPFPRDDSENEDCSRHLVDPLIGSFRPLFRRRYFLAFQDLPGYAYFLFGRRRTAYRVTAGVVNGLDRLASMLLPRHTEHVLFAGKQEP